VDLRPRAEIKVDKEALKYYIMKAFNPLARLFIKFAGCSRAKDGAHPALMRPGLYSRGECFTAIPAPNEREKLSTIFGR
jgi:hypothetical protein